MARWKLRQKHYLNVPGTEYDYKETTNTGRQKRLVFEVPAYLDPDNPGDQNYPGEVIVAYADKGMGRDIIFVGPPTPDMEPLDDEAREISAGFAKTWQHPIDTLGDGGYGEMLERSFEKAMLKLPQAPAAAPQNDDVAEALRKMQAQIDLLAAENTALRGAAGAETGGEQHAGRRL